MLASQMQPLCAPPSAGPIQVDDGFAVMLYQQVVPHLQRRAAFTPLDSRHAGFGQWLVVGFSALSGHPNKHLVPTLRQVRRAGIVPGTPQPGLLAAVRNSREPMDSSSWQGGTLGRRTNRESLQKIATGRRPSLRPTQPDTLAGSTGAVPTKWGVIPAMSSRLARSPCCGASDDSFAATQSRWSRRAIDASRTFAKPGSTKRSCRRRASLHVQEPVGLAVRGLSRVTTIPC